MEPDAGVAHGTCRERIGVGGLHACACHLVSIPAQKRRRCAPWQGALVPPLPALLRLAIPALSSFKLCPLQPDTRRDRMRVSWHGPLPSSVCPFGSPISRRREPRSIAKHQSMEVTIKGIRRETISQIRALPLGALSTDIGPCMALCSWEALGLGAVTLMLAKSSPGGLPTVRTGPDNFSLASADRTAGQAAPVACATITCHGRRSRRSSFLFKPQTRVRESRRFTATRPAVLSDCTDSYTVHQNLTRLVPCNKSPTWVSPNGPENSRRHVTPRSKDAD